MGQFVRKHGFEKAGREACDQRSGQEDDGFQATDHDRTTYQRRDPERCLSNAHPFAQFREQFGDFAGGVDVSASAQVAYGEVAEKGPKCEAEDAEQPETDDPCQW